MNRQIANSGFGRRASLPLLLSTLLVLAASTIARADLIVAAQSVSANVGSANNTLELTLQNTGPTAVNIGGFSFGVSTAGADINFTSADINTATALYIFAGNSLFGPTINTTSGASLLASDFSVIVAGVDVPAGNTVGLGRLLFDVAPGAAGGPHVVAIMPFPTTSLNDSSGTDVPITTLLDGAILVNGAQIVPEPAALCSAAVALAIGAGAWVRGRRSRIVRG